MQWSCWFSRRPILTLRCVSYRRSSYEGKLKRWSSLSSVQNCHFDQLTICKWLTLHYVLKPASGHQHHLAAWVSSHCCSFPLQCLKLVLSRCKSLVWAGLLTRTSAFPVIPVCVCVCVCVWVSKRESAEVLNERQWVNQIWCTGSAGSPRFGAD